ncbi:hypothetical protein GH733_010807, partial [Mirounga leonina]
MPVFVNARLKSGGTRFQLNDQLDFECYDGYENRLGHTTGSTSVVTLVGLIHPHVMLVKLCGTSPQLPNGEVKETIKENYEHNELVEYVCNPGFLMKGPSKIQCVDGKWTTLPICIENIPCSQPSHIEHGIISSSSEERKETFKPRLYAHGTKLSYICEDGFRISEEDGIMCYMGKWSSPPQCVEMYCSSLPDFGDAMLIGPKKDSYRSGEKVTYKCPEYYQLDGSNIVQCIKSQWIGRPICRDVSCVNPPRVKNAIILNEMPRYLPGKCGLPPPIDNGDITSFPLPAYAPGSSAEYQCQAFYALQGNRNVICSNGQWSKPPKCLDGFRISEDGIMCYMGKWSSPPQCV